jgi:hypothetical protein
MNRRGETGAVTAETAVALPVLVLVAAALAWFVSVGVTQARTGDAARETVRSLVRGDDAVVAEALGRRVAPDGARFRIRRDLGTVTVRVDAAVAVPPGILGFLGGREVHAEATAASEPGS